MPVPNYPAKFQHPATFTPHDLVRANPAAALAGVPPNVLICFQNRPLRYLVRKYRGKKAGRFMADFYHLRRPKMPIGVAGGLGIGAPAAVFVLEWLAGLGAVNFLVVGFAGGLVERLSAGSLVLCDRAVRDEGASHHYLATDKYAYPDSGLTNALSEQLKRKALPFETGGSWTTDAPFRETLAEVEHYAGEGVLTVEMEAAALFAAAQAIGVRCAAAFSVGDSLKGGRWNLAFDREAMGAGLETLAQAGLDAFESLPGAP